MGEKWRFRRVVPVQTTMMPASFKLAIMESIVLDAIVDKKEHSYESFVCLSLSQTNFTTLVKIAPFHPFFDVWSAKRGERTDLLAESPVDRLYLIQ